MSPGRKKYLRLALAGCALLVALIAIGWAFAPTFLMVDSGFRSAEVVVVLGGESWTRPTRCAEVFAESRPAIVLVSGNGDCQDVRRQLEAQGVPHSVIETECDSKTTYENALFSAKLLRARGVTNAVIVTSWFHSRRALACFRTVAPEIDFTSRPTPKPNGNSLWSNKYERRRVTQEYAKIVYYWIVYGVSPFKV